MCNEFVSVDECPIADSAHAGSESSDRLCVVAICVAVGLEGLRLFDETDLDLERGDVGRESDDADDVGDDRREPAFGDEHGREDRVSYESEGAACDEFTGCLRNGSTSSPPRA